MFTGIIEATARISQVIESDGGLEIRLPKPRGWKVKTGESININGVCSTVKKSGASLGFFYMPETLAKSNGGLLQQSSLVNVERSVPVTARLDGHIVQGHVDCTGVVSGIQKEGDAFVVDISFSAKQKKMMRYIVSKGSVAVEGISLTVSRVFAGGFSVSLIPHTWNATNLHQKKVGSILNIEFDILAKYLEQLTNKNYR